MSIKKILNKVLSEYDLARSQRLANHPLAEVIRTDFPVAVKETLVLSDRYFVKGSPGQGSWAGVPWVGIFDRMITDSPQQGFYIVFLAKEDSSGFFLSLNQGVTAAKNHYGSEAKHALSVRAADYLARLDSTPKDCLTGPINLAVTNPSSLGALYEQGNVFAKLYEQSSIPSDVQIWHDLEEFLEAYYILASKELSLNESTAEEEDEVGLSAEEKTNLREHKRIERNIKLAKKAKKIHGYVCSACDFDFQANYGEIGRDFIEAHHLTPLSHLKGKKVSLNPRKDFAVLCSNCHRMIHRTQYVSEVREFRAKYVVKRR